MKINIDWNKIEHAEIMLYAYGEPLLIKIDDHTAELNVEGLINAINIVLGDYIARMTR